MPSLPKGGRQQQKAPMGRKVQSPFGAPLTPRLLQSTLDTCKQPFMMPVSHKPGLRGRFSSGLLGAESQVLGKWCSMVPSSRTETC